MLLLNIVLIDLSINSVQRSNTKLCSSSNKIRSFPKTFLETFENAAPDVWVSCAALFSRVQRSSSVSYGYCTDKLVKSLQVHSQEQKYGDDSVFLFNQSINQSINVFINSSK